MKAIAAAAAALVLLPSAAQARGGPSAPRISISRASRRWPRPGIEESRGRTLRAGSTPPPIPLSPAGPSRCIRS
jgi:hypothetical protein